jgi:hypothetical protein
VETTAEAVDTRSVVLHTDGRLPEGKHMGGADRHEHTDDATPPVLALFQALGLAILVTPSGAPWFVPAVMLGLDARAFVVALYSVC